jgi:hypothetical protein
MTLNQTMNPLNVIFMGSEATPLPQQRTDYKRFIRDIAKTKFIGLPSLRTMIRKTILQSFQWQNPLHPKYGTRTTYPKVMPPRRESTQASSFHDQ